MQSQLPCIFIGSSSESLDIAREVEVQFDNDALVTVWNNDMFRPSRGTLEELLEASSKFDFAVMILTPDDLLESRGTSFASPRDNVLFELGLFMGKLGRERTFIMHERNVNLKLPSDLDGIGRVLYRQRPDNNWAATVSPCCTQMRRQIHFLGTLKRQLSEPLLRFANFYLAADTMEAYLKECLCHKASMSIRWIGTSMDYGWPLLKRCLDKLPTSNPYVVNLEIAMLSSDWSDIDAVNKGWRTTSDTIAVLIQKYRDAALATKTAQVNISLYRYKHMPNITGLLVDNEYLFLNYCTWIRGELSSGDNEYELYTSHDQNIGRHKIAHYNAWFDYCITNFTSIM